MPEPKRLLTTTEAAQIRAALPAHLQPLMDHVYTIEPNCWNCEFFDTADGMCLYWKDAVPMDKRQGDKPCWQHNEPEPF